jgi:ADP-ribose pyrophosphatase YjhB (NUDIX family)
VTVDPAAAGGIVQRTRLAAYAWCETNGAVLLCRLRMDDPDGGAWTLPGGGLEFGEDPMTGALRELAEETGYAARVDELAGIRSEVFEPEETLSGHRIHYVAILYRATVTGGSLRDEPDGSTDHAEWVPLDQIDGLRIVDLVAWARATAGR